MQRCCSDIPGIVARLRRRPEHPHTRPNSCSSRSTLLPQASTLPISDERTLVTQTIIVKLLRGGLLCQRVGGRDWQREFTVGSRCGASCSESESRLGLAFCKVETDLDRCCAIVRLKRSEHGRGARLPVDWQ
jgi:hypothetical protein